MKHGLSLSYLSQSVLSSCAGLTSHCAPFVLCVQAASRSDWKGGRKRGKRDESGGKGGRKAGTNDENATYILINSQLLGRRWLQRLPRARV